MALRLGAESTLSRAERDRPEYIFGSFGRETVEIVPILKIGGE